jgi:NAD(P)-dependent dehydrogenase (short-subunit alcohol dehydrogenase family)
MTRRRYPPAGKAILITGASRGLGRALALALAQKGARLALTARDEAALEETAALCRSAGAETFTFAADLEQPDACARLVEQSVAALGGLDVLIANAGRSMWAHFEDVTDLGLYEELVRVNYLSVVALIHAALPHLLESNGAIVAVSTSQTWTGMPSHTGYAASKAALQGFLDSLSMEVGDDVHILSVYPGWIRGTNLRASALGADGQPLHSARRAHNSLSVTAEACAAALVRGLERGRHTVFVPRYMRLLQIARPFAFPLLQRILAGAAHSQKSTHPHPHP